MSYSAETGRAFWHDFDHHFRYEAAASGYVPHYQAIGGDAGAADAWADARSSGVEASFAAWAEDRRDAITHLANAQEDFIKARLTTDEAITSAFADFAFGVLESDADHRSDADDTRHVMTGGRTAPGYLHWHGFIEAVIALGIDNDFWTHLRRANAMAWELHVRAHPHESDPDAYKRLSDADSSAIESKWFTMSDDDISAAFDDYDDQSETWAREAEG